MDSVRIVSAAVSDRGLSEKRPENQDSYLEMPQRGIFAVADGVGGAQAGEVASQMAVEILGEAFANQTNNDAEDTLKAAIERANSAIFQMANELPQLSTMATTIVALHLNGDIATIGHVGDSRLYRVDRDGNLHRETADHSMVAEEVRAGRMTEAQAETHPSRNIISRALGAEADVEIDLKTIMIEPGTAFLACSDGITRHVADDEIRGVLTFGGEPDEVCEYLKNLCYERGAEDNLTAVVVKVGSAVGAADSASLPPLVPAIEAEESTVATARSPFDSKADDPLELDTQELIKSEAVAPGADEADKTFEPASPSPAFEDEERTEAFSMFGGSDDTSKSEAAGSGGKVLLALSMLVIGSLIGLAVYRFLLAPPEAVQSPPPLQEMKTENIPFSSYEKNRRNVDVDPAEYIKEVPQPEDAEDYYLRGRALILLRDFPNAHIALIEAQKRLGDAEQANQSVLGTDIAMALVLTNDPSLQPRVKAAIDASKSATLDGNANVSPAR